jgi:hypothetical protein
LVKSSLTNHPHGETMIFMGKLFFGQKVIGLNIILVDSRLDKSFVGERFYNQAYILFTFTRNRDF